MEFLLQLLDSGMQSSQIDRHFRLHVPFPKIKSRFVPRQEDGDNFSPSSSVG